MNVVYLTWGIPWPPRSGARIREEGMIRGLAALGAKIALICFAKDEVEIPDVIPLRQICSSVDIYRPPTDSLTKTLHRTLKGRKAGRPLAMQEFYFPELFALVRQRLLETGATVLQIEHSLMAAYVGCAAGLSHVRTVLSLHNLGWVQYRRMASLPNAGKGRWLAWLKSMLMRGWESKWAERFDLCITVSETDRHLLLQSNPGLQVVNIPNAVDTSYLRPMPLEKSRQFLFTGVLSYPPNTDAVLYFCRDVLPLLRQRIPDCKLLVAGAGASNEIRAMEGDGVNLLGEVADLRPVYEKCRAAIVPIRAGSGTRLKILEAFALGRPVVSTTIGAEGIPVADGRQLLIADAAESFAECLTRLIDDDGLCAKLAANGRELVEKEFSVSAAAARWFNELKTLSEAAYAGSVD